jgi:hypothetical protein
MEATMTREEHMEELIKQEDERLKGIGNEPEPKEAPLKEAEILAEGVKK